MKVKSYTPFLIISCVLFFMFAIKDKYIINPSKSLPRGIYKIIDDNKSIKKGDIVCFTMPKDIETLAKKRNYILQNANTLMKIVAADKNDKVELKNNELFINNVSWGKISYYDSYSRKLEPKSIKELQPKNDDEFLLLSKVKNSFDGRYIGLIKKENILYKTEILCPF